MTRHLMFVYGTLKQNQPNHRLLSNPDNGFMKYLGPGHTVNRYPLVILTEYHIPCVLYEEGKGQRIKGELYEVDDRMLAVLDHLEDHPRLYERIVIPISKTGTNGQSEDMYCWLYFIKNYKPEFLDLPYYSDYDTNGDHGKPYVTDSKEHNFDLRKLVIRNM